MGQLLPMFIILYVEQDRTILNGVTIKKGHDLSMMCKSQNLAMSKKSWQRYQSRPSHDILMDISTIGS